MAPTNQVLHLLLRLPIDRHDYYQDSHRIGDSRNALYCQQMRGCLSRHRFRYSNNSDSIGIYPPPQSKESIGAQQLLHHILPYLPKQTLQRPRVDINLL